MAGQYKKRSRVNWGFVVVVSALAAVAVLITLAKPLGLEGLPTWDMLLAEPATQAAKPSEAPEEAKPRGQEAARVSVHIIDVGQGDSILVQTEDSNVLIDAGPADAAQAVVRYLRAQGVERLDLVIATHPHADHIGGMAEVVKRFPVERLIAPEVADAGGYSYEKLLEAVLAKGLRLTRPHPGDVYDLGGASLTLLGPVEQDAANVNNNSVVARVTCGQTSFLLTGDCEAEEESTLLAADEALLTADVLKLGHHGSRTSTTAAFLQAVNPRWAVASCAWDNSYGHPHSEVLRRLERAGVAVLRTDLDGTVVFTSDGTSVAATQEKAKENAA